MNRFLLLLIFFASSSMSQIPYRLSYQGLLTSPTGALAPDGSYDLKFEIYNDPTVGSLRFTETQTGVFVVRGTFSVSLGSVTTLTAIFSEPLYVQVTAMSGPGIGAPTAFSPRAELTSAPYSLAPWSPTPTSISYRGNVGVGSSSPGANNRLDIRGEDTTTSKRALVVSDSSGSGMFFIRNDKTAGFGFGPNDAGTSPILTVRGETNDTTGWALNITQRSYATALIVRNDGNVGMGDQSPDARLDVKKSAGTVAIFDRTTDDGTIVSIQQGSIEEGSISVTGTTVSYNAFTGSHFGWTGESLEAGTLVTLTGENRRFHDNQASEIIYGIAPSAKANDPTCLGAYLGKKESNQASGSENPHLVMAVGNGVMWVVENGADIHIGDYLISSDVRGHAMRDTDVYEVSNVIARAAEPLQWNGVTKVIDGKRHKQISVFFENFAKRNTLGDSERLFQLEKEVEFLKAQLRSLTVEKNSNDPALVDKLR